MAARAAAQHPDHLWAGVGCRARRAGLIGPELTLEQMRELLDTLERLAAGARLGTRERARLAGRKAHPPRAPGKVPAKPTRQAGRRLRTGPSR